MVIGPKQDSSLNNVAQGFRKPLTIWLVDWLKHGPKKAYYMQTENAWSKLV